MRKRTFVAVAVIALLVLAGMALGVGRMHVAPAHAQTPVAQTLSYNQQAGPVQNTQGNGTAVNATENDPADPGETTASPEDNGQDQNLPGGGHQDQGSAVDHQFEGTE